MAIGERSLARTTVPDTLPCACAWRGPVAAPIATTSPTLSAVSNHRRGIALEAAYQAAGFHAITVRVVDAPVRFPSAAECVRFERESFGALHQMVANVSNTDRERAWAEIAAALEPFEGPSGFVGPCELLVASGRT